MKKIMLKMLKLNLTTLKYAYFFIKHVEHNNKNYLVLNKKEL